MKVLVHLLIGVAGLWLQSTVAPLVAIGGIRPNLMLLILLVLVLRWPSPWLFVFGGLAGLARDTSPIRLQPSGSAAPAGKVATRA